MPEGTRSEGPGIQSPSLDHMMLVNHHANHDRFTPRLTRVDRAAKRLRLDRMSLIPCVELAREALSLVARLQYAGKRHSNRNFRL